MPVCRSHLRYRFTKSGELLRRFDVAEPCIELVDQLLGGIGMHTAIVALILYSLLPIVRNTPREGELVEQLQTVLADPRFERAFAVIVADHGAYIWGDDVWEAKRHTEVYHFLFEAAVARRDLPPKEDVR